MGGYGMLKSHIIVPIVVMGILILAGSTFGGDEGGDPYKGGLVWSKWTDAVAGGSGYPEGFDSGKGDFLRCKACHGWDGMGANGGYVRRSAKDSRPNPAPGSDLSPKFGLVTSEEVLYSEKGRELSDYSKAMPAFGKKGGLTEQQVKDVVAFLNKGPKIGEFATLDTSAKPVSYTFKSPDLNAGKSLYAANCASCHNEDGNGSDMSLKKYFSEDGKYSEGFHKAVYGAGGKSEMTREASGNLSGKQAADILAYIQANF
jgi:mono/diheme cytochrome c family protein